MGETGAEKFQTTCLKSHTQCYTLNTQHPPAFLLFSRQGSCEARIGSSFPLCDTGVSQNVSVPIDS